MFAAAPARSRGACAAICWGAASDAGRRCDVLFGIGTSRGASLACVRGRAHARRSLDTGHRGVIAVGLRARLLHDAARVHRWQGRPSFPTGQTVCSRIAGRRPAMPLLGGLTRRAPRSAAAQRPNCAVRRAPPEVTPRARRARLAHLEALRDDHGRQPHCRPVRIILHRPQRTGGSLARAQAPRCL